MNVLAFLVPVALLLGIIWVGVFMWTLKSGQYDDLEGEALRILDDETDDRPLNGDKPPTRRGEE